MAFAAIAESNAAARISAKGFPWRQAGRQPFRHIAKELP
jgi:hypothetical protein